MGGVVGVLGPAELPPPPPGLEPRNKGTPSLGMQEQRGMRFGGRWDGMGRDGRGVPHPSSRLLERLPQGRYDRPVRSSQAPPRWTQGDKATAGPGRPGRSEARHMRLTCADLYTHTCTRNHVTSWSWPGALRPYAKQSVEYLRSPARSGSHRRRARCQGYMGGSARSETRCTRSEPNHETTGPGLQALRLGRLARRTSHSP